MQVEHAGEVVAGRGVARGAGMQAAHARVAVVLLREAAEAVAAELAEAQVAHGELPADSALLRHVEVAVGQGRVQLVREVGVPA